MATEEVRMSGKRYTDEFKIEAGNQFGNALGASVANQNLAANGNSGGNPFAAQTENQINVGNPGDAILFGPMGNAAQWGGAGSGTSSFDTDAAFNEITGVFGQAQNGYSRLLAANDLSEPGQPVMVSDAGEDNGGYDYERSYQDANGVIHTEASCTPFTSAVYGVGLDGALSTFSGSDSDQIDGGVRISVFKAG
jgi:hypothetical protein